MRRSIKKRSSTNEPTKARLSSPEGSFLLPGYGWEKGTVSGNYRGGGSRSRHTPPPAKPAPGEPFLGVLDFKRRESAFSPAQPPPRTPADHAAAPARAGRGPGGADPDRARGEGLPRRAGPRRPLRLR